MEIEYGGNKQAPLRFIIQAQEVLLENIDGRFMLSTFARNLARSYLPNLKKYLNIITH